MGLIYYDGALIEYLNRKHEKLSALNSYSEGMLKNILWSVAEKFNVFRIQASKDNESARVVVRCHDDFFHEYYSKFKYLYNNKAYFVMYQMHLKHKKTKYRQKTHRKTISLRDGNKCVMCGETSNLTLDHIFPFHKSGDDTPYNQCLMCDDCNQLKGGSDRNSSKILKQIISRGQRKEAGVDFSDLELLDEYIEFGG